MGKTDQVGGKNSEVPLWSDVFFIENDWNNPKFQSR